MNVTNLNYTHKYNPNGPAGYLLTFHTYGMVNIRHGRDMEVPDTCGMKKKYIMRAIMFYLGRPRNPFLTVGARHNDDVYLVYILKMNGKIKLEFIL